MLEKQQLLSKACFLFVFPIFCGWLARQHKSLRIDGHFPISFIPSFFGLFQKRSYDIRYHFYGLNFIVVSYLGMAIF